MEAVKYSTSDLMDLTARELFMKLDELKDLARDLGREMAQKEEEYLAIEKMLPSHLANIQCVNLRSMGPTEARIRALADPQYQAKVMEMVSKKAAHTEIEAEWKGAIKSIDAIGGVSYVLNQELKMAHR